MKQFHSNDIISARLPKVTQNTFNMAEVERVDLPPAPTSAVNTNARTAQTPSATQPNNTSNGAQTNGNLYFTILP